MIEKVLIINKINKYNKELFNLKSENEDLQKVIMDNNINIFDNIFIKNTDLKEENYKLMLQNNELKIYNNNLILENKRLLELNKDKDIINKYIILKNELYNIKKHYYTIQDSLFKKN